MSNQNEIDYEKQFQEDLAKATALSLEQQALEEFKRGQKYGIAYTQSVQQEAKNRNYAQIRRQHYARRDSSESSATTHHGVSLPPPQSNQPQRRHSEITHNKAPSTLLTDIERSRTPPATAAAENDLINFASPTSTKPENTTFEKLIEDLHKLQTTNPQTALMPLAPTPAAPPQYAGYHTPAATAMYAATAAANIQQSVHYGVTAPVAAAGMQLVPFTPPPPQQKVPLTHDELQKLYSMSQPPYTAALYGPRPIGFMPGLQGAGYYRQTAPTMMPAAGAPFSAPVQYPNPFGFPYNVTAPPTAIPQHYYSPNLGSTNLNSPPIAGSSLATNAYNLNSNVQQTLNTNLSSTHNNFSQTHSQASTSSNAASQTNGQNNFRRHTPPARKPKATGSDLIDLSHEDDSRVSVLEAFDPLLNENDDVIQRLKNYM